MNITEHKDAKFANLVERVKGCDRCPRMRGSARVLGAGCGPLSAKLMFIGEAPGRLGADSSELPFHGDRSGHNFESLLDQVSLSRYDAFVTNAVLCNPKDERGNNTTPTSTEIANCSEYLKEQIELIDCPIVVTLGGTALKATALIEDHGLSLSTSVRTTNSWAGRLLIPAYHPGQRAMIHRSFANQLADYQFISESLRRLASPRRKGAKATAKSRRSETVAAAAKLLLEQSGELSYFSLHKMLFLAEVRHLEATAQRLTGGYYVRQKDGPYCVDLHPARIATLIPGIKSRVGNGILFYSVPHGNLFNEDTSAPLRKEAREIINQVARKYSTFSADRLKTATYLTRPMRELMRKERLQRLNLFNAPLLPPPSRD